MALQSVVFHRNRNPSMDIRAAPRSYDEVLLVRLLDGRDARSSTDFVGSSHRDLIARL